MGRALRGADAGRRAATRRKTEPLGIVTAAWDSIGDDIARAQRHLEEAMRFAIAQANVETRTTENGEAAMNAVADAAEALTKVVLAFEILDPMGGGRGRRGARARRL